jgi:AcrR family transcriptional regulator
MSLLSGNSGVLLNAILCSLTGCVKIDCTPMSSERRKYELKKRAEGMAETRRRITEAAVDLHGTIGPARTTVSAVADRAGVQRHTVYRHFPSERELFAACSAHWGAEHPFPDPARWRGLEEGLDELYGWYDEAEPILTNILRDRVVSEVVDDTMAPIKEFWDEARRRLAAGLPRRKTVSAAVAHAVDFRTWQSLVREGGLSRAQAARLMTSLVESA